MKKQFFALMVIGLIFISTSYAGDEEKAVIKTIEKEQAALNENDFDNYKTYWAHEDFATYTYVQTGMYTYLSSWDSIAKTFKKNLEGDPGMKFKSEDFKVTIFNDIAKVTATVHQTFDFLGESLEAKLTGQYILQKVDKDWKIISVTLLDNSSYDPTDKNIEWKLNVTGYYLLYIDKIDESIKVFQLNTELYPDAFNTWDSLAEAFMKKGDNNTAIKYYKKSLELNPKNTNAKDMIAKIEKGGKE